MNDESFISGGITNESPNLIVKLFDENGINTSSGVGHDIVAIIDSDQLNSYILNDYYQANIDCQDYLDDLNNMEPSIDRSGLIQKYNNFFKMKKLAIDKDVLAETSNLQLLSTLAMLAPFNKIDKQAILESPNIASRFNTINSILDLNTFQVVGKKNPNQLN